MMRRPAPYRCCSVLTLLSVHVLLAACSADTAVIADETAITVTGKIDTAAKQYTIDTIAGNGSPTNNGDTGDALKTAIGQTFGVEIGPDAALYVTEVQNHRVRRVDMSTGKISTVAGNGAKGYAGDGKRATEASMNEPYEVRFDRDGNMYVVEMMNHIVRRVDKATGIIRTIAGTGVQGYGGDGGPAKEAKLSRPHSIALDDQGGLYIADIGNHRIRRVDLETGLITTVAGNGAKQLPTDGGKAAGNPMLGPRALYVRGDKLWIALREGHSVWNMSLKTGVLTHVAGSGDRGYLDNASNPKLARFNGPKGVACDGMGNVYVVDTENQVIRRIDPKRQTVSTVAGAGPKARGFKGDGSTATQGWLDRPHGICLDAQGNLYIGDTNNHRVRICK